MKKIILIFHPLSKSAEINIHQTLINDKGQMTNDNPNELALFVPTYLSNL
jgi:hypothetical protein